MSWVEEIISKVEKTMEETGVTFDRRLKDLETMSVEENARIARERFESRWKDELRRVLGPFDEAMKRGEAAKALLILVLRDVVGDMIASRARDAVSRHYLFREIRSLEQRLKKLEAAQKSPSV